MKELIKALSEIKTIVNNLDLGTIPSAPASDLVEPDLYGFYPISTLDGAREIHGMNLLLDDWVINGDKLQKKIAREMPRKVLVNYQLTNVQIESVFRPNNNRNFMIHSTQVRGYKNIHIEHEGKGAFIIFRGLPTEHEPYLSATAGNWSFVGTLDGYEKYLKSVEASCIRFCYNQYDLEFSLGKFPKK